MFNSGSMERKFYGLFACLVVSFAAKLFSATHGDEALSFATEKEMKNREKTVSPEDSRK
jgi:hypothetical protein